MFAIDWCLNELVNVSPTLIPPGVHLAVNRSFPYMRFNPPLTFPQPLLSIVGCVNNTGTITLAGHTVSPAKIASRKPKTIG